MREMREQKRMTGNDRDCHAWLREEFRKPNPEQSRITKIISDYKPKKLFLDECLPIGAIIWAQRTFAVKLLANALENNTTCKRLISHIRLNKSCVITLTEMLERNTSLYELNLDGSGINDEGAVVLKKMLASNKNILTLNLTRNNLGKAGIEAIAEGLEENYTLLELHLFYNSDSAAEGFPRLAQAIKKNKKLMICNFFEGSEYAEEIESYVKENSLGHRPKYLQGIRDKIQHHTPIPLAVINEHIMQYLSDCNQEDLSEEKDKKNNSNEDLVLAKIHQHYDEERYSKVYFFVVKFLILILVPFFLIFVVLVGLQQAGGFNLNDAMNDLEKFVNTDVKAFWQTNVPGTPFSNGAVISLMLGCVLLLGIGAYYLRYKNQKLEEFQAYVPLQREPEIPVESEEAMRINP